ncbi:sensor histidine kinase [Pseudochryseolinea flava]|uniref:histidine kinase n=1 Tax=Pseudochryseolinea flava TaxID=2059302 RepID=A0A364Y0B6_9BACT|nr:HAMP domain-containing sensor histidine kinase [Pseudochryseolinea flava]RAV99722.1 hypothetical protein DQQ10_16850 [Pseudochryseolinea flava]
MKAWLHRFFVTTALAALGVLTIIQVVWFSNAYRIEEQQFNDKVNLVLRSVADQLLHERGNDSLQILPVQQKATNLYSLKIDFSVRYRAIDSLVRRELLRQHIDAPFTIAVKELENHQLILGGYVEHPSTDEEIGCIGRVEHLMPVTVELTFPQKRSEILSAHTFWIISAVILATVVFIGGYLIYDLKNQNRLTTLKNEFINNMTHELNTPIANISMASEVLRAERTLDQKDKVRRYLDIIHEENIRLKLHVEQVLRTMQLEKGTLALAQQKIDLNVLLKDVAMQFTSRIQLRNGEIVSRLQAINAIVVGDAFHLRNMFCNLLDNADKYSSTAPDILIETENVNQTIQVKVSDKGIGIAAEAQRYIFEKFYRASTGLQHDIKGFGLGLTYVQQIVNAHGGDVHVKSEENSGSCFTISLPLTD